MASKDMRKALEATRTVTVTRTAPFNTGISTAGEKGRITVDLGPDLYRSLKTTTSWHGEQMSDVIRDLVSQWVAEHPIDNDAPAR
jgi:hypothetical protein